MDIEIKEITFKQVKRHVKAAKKEGITFDEIPEGVEHHWLGAYTGKKLMGMCLMTIYLKHARHAGTYVLKKYRMQGIFRLFMGARERLAMEHGCTMIFATCLPHSWKFLRSLGYYEIQNKNNVRYIGKRLKGQR
jgi:hypothetical protein